MSARMSVRFGVEGEAQVERTITKIADETEASTRRQVAAYNRAAADFEAAERRKAAAAAKVAAIMPQTALQMQIGDANRTGFGQWEGSAKQSAAAFRALFIEEERLEAQTRSFLASLYPAIAAQQRFDAEMAQAKSLIGQGAISLDDYCAKLRQEQAVLEQTSTAHGRGAASAGAHRAAMANLSFQAQDTFTQLSMGANPLQVLAIQGGQAAGAMIGLEGAAGKVARFMLGPWGLAFTGALLVLGPLVDKLRGQNDELDKAIDKLKEDARQAAIGEKAHAAYARTLEGQIEAQRKLNGEMDRTITSQRQINQQHLDQSQDNVTKRTAELAALEERLRQAEADERKARQRALNINPDDPEGSTYLSAASGASARADDLRREVAKARTALDEARQGVRLALIPIQMDKADAATDPIRAITQRYSDLIDKAKEAAEGNERLARSLDKTVLGYNRKRDAEIAAEQKRQTDARKKPSAGGVGGNADVLTAATVAKLLRDTLPGVHITSTSRTPEHNATVGGAASSYHVKGNAIDFVPAGGVSSMTKEDVRKIFTSRGIEIIELLGPGDKGHSDHFHVAWTKGKLALDEFNDAAKRAIDIQKELDGDLADIVSAFDPARVAAERYQQTLDKIARLVAGGRLNPGEALKYQIAAMNQAEADRVARQAEATARILGPIPDIMPEIEANHQAWVADEDARKQKQLDTVRTVADTYRQLMTGGVNSFLDIFRQRGLTILAELLAKWTVGKAAESGGGILGGLAKIFFPHNASGTEYWPGGMTFVGEHGAELVNLPRGSRVTPAGETRRMLAQGGMPAPAPMVFDLRGAVMTQDLLEQMNALAAAAAMRGAAGGAQMSQADALARASRRLGRRW